MIDRMATLRTGFRTTRSCGPDSIYELTIKFQSLADLDAADQELRDALKRERIDLGPLTGSAPQEAPPAAGAAQAVVGYNKGAATLFLSRKDRKTLADMDSAALAATPAPEALRDRIIAGINAREKDAWKTVERVLKEDSLKAAQPVERKEGE